MTTHSDSHSSPHESKKSAWTLELYREFEAICYQYGVKLRQPLISISESKSHWGSWDSELRTIRISSHLIETYAWDVVVCILKHEMAHQIVSEVFRKPEAHGPLFLAACDLLGVPEEFCKATADLSSHPLRDWKSEQTGDEETALLRKVERLLALASSTNENEAYLAMERVQALFTKHNITRLKEHRKSEYVNLTLNHQKKRIEKNQRLICSILSSHYFVNIIFSSQFDAKTLEHYRVIEVLGAKQNVLMAEYVYHFLMGQVESLWQAYKERKKCDARYKGSYQTGLLVGFREKLDTSAEKRESTIEENLTSTALVCLEDVGLKKYTERLFPRLVTTRTGASRIYGDSYHDGRRDGENIVLSQAISRKGGNQGRLLGSG